MNIKILGMNFSPRNNSNSNAILNEAFIDLKKKYPDELDYKILDIKDYNIKHCLACNECGKTKDTGEFIDCNIKDDDINLIFKEMLEADGLLIATPVYFGLPSDLFSKFIMRTRLLRHQDFKLVNKTAGVIAIAGRRSGGAETTIISTWLPLIRNGCVIVGNGDKSCQFGTMAWAGPRGHVESDHWGIIQAKDTAERVFTLAKVINAGKDSLNYQEKMQFDYKSGTRPVE